MEESHIWSRKFLVLEFISVKRIQAHIQTVIGISYVTD